MSHIVRQSKGIASTLDDVGATLVGLEHGMGFLLWLQDGHIHRLTALLVFALLVSSALFLVANLSQPFAGLMQISKEQLRHTLTPLN